MKFFTNDMIKKGENGAITLFVLMACLFFVFILSGVYISNLNKMQIQEQQLEQIKDNYARTITNFEEQAGPKPKEIYSESGLEEEAENNIDLFEYEMISNEEIEDTTFAQSLPKKTARITKIKDMYCNSVYGGIYNPEVGAKVNTYYQIKNYKGKDISDTLVIPYQAKINGEMYRITEVNLYVYGYASPSVLNREGYKLPEVNTIIYPNTVKKIFTISNNVYSDNYTIQNVILSESLSEIGTGAFRVTRKLKNITMPNSVTSIGSTAFYYSGLTSITIPNSVTNIGNSAFGICTNLKTINYKGTQEEWNKITIGTGNQSLTNATINYNYKGN